MVKTEHNLSFIWNFMSLNKSLSSSTQLLSQQVDFQVSILPFPRTGESPPLGSPYHRQREAICRQVIGLVRILGTLGGRKQVSSIRGHCPLSPCRQTQGMGLSLTEKWGAGCSSPWVGKGKENYWFFLSLLGEFGMPLFSSCPCVHLLGGFYFKLFSLVTLRDKSFLLSALV